MMWMRAPLAVTASLVLMMLLTRPSLAQSFPLPAPDPTPPPGPWLLLPPEEPDAYCDWETDPTCEPGLNACLDDIIDAGPPYDFDSVDLCYVLYAPCEFWGTCPDERQEEEEPPVSARPVLPPTSPSSLWLVLQPIDPTPYCDWETDPTCEPGLDACLDEIVEAGPPYDFDSVDLCYVLYAPCEFWGTCQQEAEEHELPIAPNAQPDDDPDPQVLLFLPQVVN